MLLVAGCGVLFAPLSGCRQDENERGGQHSGDSPGDGASAGDSDKPPTTDDVTPPGSDGSGDDTPSGGDGEPTAECETSANQPPQAPSIVTPSSGVTGVVQSDLVITTSPFVDPDGDDLGASELEIWRLRQDLLDTLVWRAQPASADSIVRLRHGAFVGGATQLLLDTRYAVRARYRDANACPRTSAWSEPARFRTDDGTQYLFDGTVVRDFYLDIPPESWDPIDAEAVPPGCVIWDRTFYPGGVTFEGSSYPGVGIHAKGGCGSSRGLWGKASFKVNLGWDDPNVAGCPEKRSLYGQSKLTFNNDVTDVTFTHEAIGYPFFRALGLPAPRVSHMRLHVNGEYWGVYVNFETIDRRFLRRWFSSNRGMMYEGTYGCDLVPENLPPTDAGGTCLTADFSASECSPAEPGDDPYGFALLRDLVARIQALPPGGFYPAVKEFFEYDTFLMQWAADSIISHHDSYEDWSRSNYRVYHNPATGKWSMIEFGIDATFSGDNDPWMVKGILAARCLEEPACEAALDAHLAQAIDVFESMNLAAEVDRIYAMIVDDVAADPRKEFDMATFDAQYAELRAWILGRPAFVRNALSTHTSSH